MSEIIQNLKRGAFIVFEGCDKSGKTTQCKKIVQFLENQNIPAKYLNFPARNTPIGEVINAYLTGKQDLTKQGIHLLFSANRWEMLNEMKKILESGTTLIVDRYSYSGIAYSVAKGLNYDWCKTPEIGLPKPDAVIFLSVPVDKLSGRGDFGSERFEETEFQSKVKGVFNQLAKENKDYWMNVDASKSENELYTELSIRVLEIVQKFKDTPLQTLWT